MPHRYPVVRRGTHLGGIHISATETPCCGESGPSLSPPLPFQLHRCPSWPSPADHPGPSSRLPRSAPPHSAPHPSSVGSLLPVGKPGAFTPGGGLGDDHVLQGENLSPGEEKPGVLTHTDRRLSQTPARAFSIGADAFLPPTPSAGIVEKPPRGKDPLRPAQGAGPVCGPCRLGSAEPPASCPAHCQQRLPPTAARPASRLAPNTRQASPQAAHPRGQGPRSRHGRLWSQNRARCPDAKDSGEPSLSAVPVLPRAQLPTAAWPRRATSPRSSCAACPYHSSGPDSRGLPPGSPSHWAGFIPPGKSHAPRGPGLCGTRFASPLESSPWCLLPARLMSD